MATHWAPLPDGLNPAARRLVGELRTLKDRHDLSLARLSASTHYSRASWERWLNGKRLITHAALTALVTRYGGDLASLTALLGQADLGPAPGRARAAADPPPTASNGPGGVRPPETAAQAAPAVLAQLPASTADFTGRRSQIEDLSAALLPGVGDPGQVSIAAVTGGGGLGKTTLAVHVAHRIGPRFPDGQLYVDLLGAGENPLTPETVLAQWLHALGEDPADVPAGLEGRAARFRSLLSRLRLLVVLDNARDVEQVRPLLPAANGCAVLITSRNRLVELPGAFRLGLSSLPDEEAMTLLAQLVGADRLAAEREATAELLRACGGIPLALRIAGARLGARAGWPVSVLARRLSDQRRRLDELAIGDLAVRASFQVGYAGLARSGGSGGRLAPGRAFRLLGLAPGPEISLPAAAALFGLADDAAEVLLEALVDAHLLECPEPDRYRMHDLIRLYAAEQAASEEDEAECREAVGRLAGWYLATAADAHRHLSPQSRAVPVDGIRTSSPALCFPTYRHAMDWCERERPNLVAAVLQAGEYGCHETCWKLAAAMLGFFNARRYLADWTSTHQVALEAAKSARDLVGEAWIQNNLGFVYFYWEETQRKALDCFERSLELRVRLGDRLGEAIALNNVGGAHHRLGDHEEAIRRLEQAMRIRDELGDELGVGQACLNIGCILADQRKPAEAETYLLRALQITDALGNRQLYLRCLNTLGDAYAGLGRTEEAKAHLYRSLELSREMRELEGEATAMQNLARTHFVEGDLEAAMRCWEQAVELYERYADPQAETVRREMAEASAGGNP